MPILWKFVGSLDNPWVTDDLVHPMQIIWNGVMQAWPHKFTEDNDKVYHLVSIDLSSPLSLHYHESIVHTKNLQLAHAVW